MINDIVLLFLAIFSIFGIIMILARKIPDVSLETEIKPDPILAEAKKRSRKQVWFYKALHVSEKALRQLRLRILKLDAKIFNLIEYLRHKSANKLEEINKSYKNITPAIEANTNKISLKLQYKIEERKLINIIAKNPKNAENYKKLGMLYFKNDNFFDAEAAFKEYLRLNPSDGGIREMLEKVALKNRERKS